MWARVVSVVLWVALIAVCGGAQADTEKRVALVIGNDEYQIVRPQLANAAADARAIGEALSKSGFDATVKTNVKRRELYQLIDAFAAQIAASPDTVGLFYYAGHGIQANGKNYLIPVDSDLESESDLEAEAVDAGKVLRAMDEAHNSVNIVILDACRDNPLPKGRSLARGLATMQGPRGTFIGYAAGPGQTAQDGAKGGNGVFTGTLVEHLHDPGLPIEEVFKRTIAGVIKRTGGKQVPWMESSLQGNFYFTAPVTVIQPPPQPPLQPAVERDVVFWESIKGSTDPADFADFLKRYPESEFASIARRRIAALTAPPPPPAAPPAAAVTAPPVPQPDAAEIARSLQSELKRVGCYNGAVDGIWGPGTQAAVQEFNQHAGKALDTQSASLESVAAVKQRTDRICSPPPPPPPRPRPRVEPASRSDETTRGAYQPPPAPAPAPPPAPAPRATGKCFTFNGKQYCE
ncbi:MAG TPA: caspase family protein [Stellaceae bacterium]|nr:caspase family protein [Stellaceae bacterium]